MRIATMIISLVLVLPIFLHACGSPLLGDSSTAEGQDAASVAMGLGFLVGILYFLGGAFALGVPLLAAILFLGAMIAAFAAEFADADAVTGLYIWGVLAVPLAAMSFVGWIGKRKQDRRARIQEQAAQAMLSANRPPTSSQRSRPSPSVVTCAKCRSENRHDARYCHGCGSRFEPSTEPSH